MARILHSCLPVSVPGRMLVHPECRSGWWRMNSLPNIPGGKSARYLWDAHLLEIRFMAVAVQVEVPRIAICTFLPLWKRDNGRSLLRWLYPDGVTVQVVERSGVTRQTRGAARPPRCARRQRWRCSAARTPNARHTPRRRRHNATVPPPRSSVAYATRRARHHAHGFPPRPQRKRRQHKCRASVQPVQRFYRRRSRRRRVAFFIQHATPLSRCHVL